MAQIGDVFFFHDLIKPMLVFPDLFQKCLVQNAVNDNCMRERRLCFLKNGDLPVLFQDGVVYVGYGGDIFEAQFTQEIFHGEPDAGHFFFSNFSVQNDDTGISVEKLFQPRAFRGKKRKNNFQGNDRENRNDGVQQGYRRIRQGICGDIRKEKGRYQFRGLNFSDLPFAGKAHNGEQEQIDEYGSYENNCQKHLPFEKV